MLLVVFFNIIFLGKLALMDARTHTVPMIATAFFVCYSLFLTTPQHLLQACLMCVLMYAAVQCMYLGTGDRKIIFALTLQLGGYFGISLLGSVFGALLLNKLQNNEKPMPLIPVILIVYILWIFPVIAAGNVI